MNGHVFECYDESGDRTQFTKTVEALREYASKHCDRPEDLRTLFEETMTMPVIPEPEDIRDDATPKQLFIWQGKMKTFNLRTDELRSNLNSLYSVIWGQCSDSMKTKLKALDEYVIESKRDNCVWLLSQIKNTMHQFDIKQHVWSSLFFARTAYLQCKQGPEQSDYDYLEVFRANVEVLEYYKANISESIDLLEGDDYANMSTAEKIKAARERTLATAFLNNADPVRYGTLLADLNNQYSRGNDQFPRDLTTAYSLLVNFRPPTPVVVPSPVTSSSTTSPIQNQSVAAPNNNNNSSTNTSAPYSDVSTSFSTVTVPPSGLIIPMWSVPYTYCGTTIILQCTIHMGSTRQSIHRVYLQQRPLSIQYTSRTTSHVCVYKWRTPSFHAYCRHH